MNEPIWIEKRIVLAVHDELVAEHGGLQGIRDLNLLESSLNSPKHLFFYQNPKPCLEALAARYAYSLTRNHPFNDGNKRTAFFACVFFLEQNEIETNFAHDASFLMMLELSVGKIAEAQFVWCQEYISKKNRSDFPN
jgi:death on curing protein